MKSVCTFCFRNLGVGTRLKMYEYLSVKGEKNVSEITKHIDLTQPTVSYHLKEMYDSGLLVRTAKGKEVFYAVRTMCPHDDSDCVLQINAKNN